MRALHVLTAILVVVPFGSARPGAAQVAVPTGLTATSATRSAVALAWTAPDATTTKFVVLRKPLGASWTPPPPPAASPIVTTPVTGVTMTDSAIGAFTTYVYRVHVAGVGNALGPASNEITVGPPPVGFSQINVEPAKLNEPQQFAPALSMTLDANGDPALAYPWFDPDNNSDNGDTTLHFVSWNRAKYRWNAPVTVAVIGDIDTNSKRFNIALTRDAATNRFGLAHMTGGRDVRIAFSDDGVAWNDVGVATAPEGGTLGEPSVAMDKGRVFLAYSGEGHAIVLASGLATDPPDKWSSETAPLLPDTFQPRQMGLQVAVDSGGKPAVIYWITPMSDYNMTLAFWRPEAKTVVKVTDTNGEQSDFVDSRLAFNGPHASVAFYALRDKQFWDNQHQIWIASSTDNGVTWGAASPMPADGSNSVGPPVSLALDTQGRPVIVAPVDGGSNGGRKCGAPKLFRQSAAAWTVCAPDTKGSPAGVTQPRVVFADNNKLYIAFKGLDEGGGLKAGLILWRER